MRWRSTTASVLSEEITILACLETLFAMLATVGLAIKFDSLFHIALSSSIAPLLLLRSRKSVALGKQWFNRGFTTVQRLRDRTTVLEETDEMSNTGHTLSIVHLQMIASFLKIGLLAYSVLVRMVATMAYPITGLKAIPQNWRRIALSTDSLTPLELVPATGSVLNVLRPISPFSHITRVEDSNPNITAELIDNELESDAKMARMTRFFSLVVISVALMLSFILGEEGRFFALIVALPFVGLLISVSMDYFAAALCLVSALIIRFSLKATSLVWLPLIYVVSTVSNEGRNLDTRLWEVRRSSVWTLIRAVSWITIAALAWKILFLPGVLDWWNAQRWTAILDVYVMPEILHPWHIAAGLNAFIALAGFYIWFDKAPRYLKDEQWKPAAVEKGLRAFGAVRSLISLYTISIGLYLTYLATKKFDMPSWGRDLFPW